MDFIRNYEETNNIKIRLDGVKEKFICHLCKDILFNPKISTCLCRFCSLCIERFIEINGTNCPKCSSNNNSIQLDLHPDIDLASKIKKLKILCLNPACNERISIEEMMNHLTNCQKSNVDCSLKEYGCTIDRLTNETIDNHFNLYQRNHLNLIIKYIETVKNEITEKNEGFQNLMNSDLIEILNEKIGLITTNFEAYKNGINNRLTALENSSIEKDEKISALETNLILKNEKIKTLELNLKQKDKTISDLEAKFDDKLNVLERKLSQNNELRNIKTDMNKKMKELESKQMKINADLSFNDKKVNALELNINKLSNKDVEQIKDDIKVEKDKSEFIVKEFNEIKESFKIVDEKIRSSINSHFEKNEILQVFLIIEWEHYHLIDVYKKDTIKEVKRKIGNKFDILTDQAVIRFEREILEDDKTIADSGINYNDVIRISNECRNSDFTIIIKDMSSDKHHALRISGNTSCFKLNRKVNDILGHYTTKIYNGTHLSESQTETISELGLNNVALLCVHPLPFPQEFFICYEGN